MTKESLSKMTKTDLLNLLNQSQAHNHNEVVELYSDAEKEEFDAICAECYGQTHEKSYGDEGLTVCSCCETVEGKTLEITVIPSLMVAYIWNTKKWIESSDDIGQEL